MEDIKSVITALTADLNPRQKDILFKRFALQGSAKAGLTLAELGSKYGITRERVRQIEAGALASVGEKIASGAGREFFSRVKFYMDNFGNIRLETAAIQDLSREFGVEIRPLQLALLFKATGSYRFYPEDKDYHDFWYSDQKALQTAQNLTVKVYDYFSSRKDEVLSGGQSSKIHTGLIREAGLKEEIGLNYLRISKKFDSNKYGDFGLAEWPEICPKTVKDRAYLVLKNFNKPAHFKEVAQLIKGMNFDSKKVYASTVHNELIKDSRFVLVGRGVYALREFGYQPGTAREVIARILKNKGPLPSGDLVKLVLKERMFKENTVLLNLQNKRFFKRTSDGSYSVNEA